MLSFLYDFSEKRTRGLVMAGDSPNEDHHVLEWVIIGFEVFFTIFGSWKLNFIFRKTVNIKWKENRIN